jgi:ribosomal protein S18 acetylase RimI-like enzyme
LSKNDQDAIVKFVSDGFRYHVALAGDEIVGFVGIRDNRHLYHLFVAESFQRRGVGRRLWEVAHEECRSRSHAGPFTVNSSTNAIPMYERLGFRRTAPTQDQGGVVFNPMALSDA